MRKVGSPHPSQKLMISGESRNSMNQTRVEQSNVVSFMNVKKRKGEKKALTYDLI